MPESIGNRTVFSLKEVGNSIRKTLRERYTQQYWVKAEMNKLNHYMHSGHCFPELVEKVDGKVVAELRGVIWKHDYERIQNTFINLIKEPLKDGIEILFLASIQFDAVYGLSLNISDIDPGFSLGQLELERLKSIEKLKAENLFDANKKLQFPLVPKKIAVISVETSKGYSDFIQIIQNNPFKYHFELSLFPALLQGEKSVVSIINQLQNIQKELDLDSKKFDVVLIIRGGGGEVGLASYNNYELARSIASFSIPIMTGIGHSTNDTVSEMVAYRKAITPSELADFLIQHFHEFSLPIESASNFLIEKLPLLFERQYQFLQNYANQYHRVVKKKLREEELKLTSIQWRISKETSFQFKKMSMNLEQIQHHIKLLDPQNVLNRGYSITFSKGKAISNFSELEKGDEVETRLANGKFKSIVSKKFV